jgi:hypothetical protein
MEDTKTLVQKALGMVLQLNYLLYGWVAEIENKTIDPSIEEALKQQLAVAMGMLASNLVDLGVKDNVKEAAPEAESTPHVEEVG